MKIRDKLNISILFYVSVIFVIMFVALLTLRQTNNAKIQWVISEKVTKGIFELNLLTSDYLLNHRTRSKIQWMLTHEILEKLLSDLIYQNSDETIIPSRLLSQLDSIKTLFSQLVANYEEQTINNSSSDNSLVRQRLINIIFIKSQEIISQSSQMEDRAQKKIMAAQRTTYILLIVITILFGTAVFAGSILVRRSILKPLSNLQKETKIIGSGILDFKVESRSRDEFGQLYEAFEQMVNNLKTVMISRDKLENELRENAHDLGERVKELNCLYRISKLLDNSRITIEEAIQGVTDLIPPGWQYPEITCARVIIDGNSVGTMNFEETIWEQTSEIMVMGNSIGTVTVCYLEERPELDEGPFLNEERNLIEAIANHLGKSIEQTQAEEALRDSEERYRLLAENVNAGLFRRSLPDGRYEYISPGLTRMTGYGPEEFYNDQNIIKKLIPKEWVETFAQRKVDPTAYNESLNDIFPFYRKSGEMRWGNQIVTPVRDEAGNIISIQGVIVDITDLKLTEETLRESELKYRLLAENVHDVIWTTDAEFKFNYISPSIKDLLGIDSESDISHLLTAPETEAFRDDTNGIVDDLKHMVSTSDKESLKNEKLPIHEIMHQTIDGEAIWVEVTTNFIFNEHDEFVGVVGITREITDRKKAVRERAALESQLFQAQKMEAIGTLAGGIAHDINNLLSPIIGYTEIALNYELPKNSPARKSLGEVIKAGNRAKEIVKQILTLSRRVEQEVVPVKVTPVIIEALNLIRATLPSSIDIQQEITAEYDTVICDSSQIHQVIMNLCTNAFHAMPDEKGVITVRLIDFYTDSKTMVQNNNLTSGQYLKLSVSDTGSGIDPGEIDRIFEPYFTTKPIGEGSGLGLAVVQGIVKSYGGDITVESELGQGSTFNIFLPVVERAFTEEPVNIEPLAQGNERILFIDDESSVREVGKMALEYQGFEVSTFENPLEALEIFRECPDRFDLVITDMTMPQMTGDILAKEILKIRPGIPVIICTGYSTRITPETAKGMGIQGFLNKPYSTLEIAAAVRNVLDSTKSF